MARFRDLVAAIRRDIQAGCFDEKGRLPTHEEIAEKYECSAGLVHRAIKLLKKEGDIHCNHAGTFLGPGMNAGADKPTWLRKCHTCPNLFQAPGSIPYAGLRPLMAEHGWVWRGSARGFDSYCPTHNPWSKEEE